MSITVKNGRAICTVLGQTLIAKDAVTVWKMAGEVLKAKGVLK